jgi:hypothetical protein
MREHQLINATGWIHPQACNEDGQQDRLVDINNP